MLDKEHRKSCHRDGAVLKSHLYYSSNLKTSGKTRRLCMYVQHCVWYKFKCSFFFFCFSYLLYNCDKKHWRSSTNTKKTTQVIKYRQQRMKRCLLLEQKLVCGEKKNSLGFVVQKCVKKESLSPRALWRPRRQNSGVFNKSRSSNKAPQTTSSPLQHGPIRL